MALGDAINFRRHRAGIGVDVEGDECPISYFAFPAAVMAGLVPAIHAFVATCGFAVVEADPCVAPLIRTLF